MSRAIAICRKLDFIAGEAEASTSVWPNGHTTAGAPGARTCTRPAPVSHALPDGIRDCNANHILIEFKYTESLTADAIRQAVSYEYFYRTTN